MDLQRPGDASRSKPHHVDRDDVRAGDAGVVGLEVVLRSTGIVSNAQVAFETRGQRERAAGDGVGVDGSDVVWCGVQIDVAAVDAERAGSEIGEQRRYRIRDASGLDQHRRRRWGNRIREQRRITGPEDQRHRIRCLPDLDGSCGVGEAQRRQRAGLNADRLGQDLAVGLVAVDCRRGPEPGAGYVDQVLIDRLEASAGENHQ